MIELMPPDILMKEWSERFTVVGFVCPLCRGYGWHWKRVEKDKDFGKVPCRACGGTGEVDAEVTVNWKRQKEGV